MVDWLFRAFLMNTCIDHKIRVEIREGAILFPNNTVARRQGKTVHDSVLTAIIKHCKMMTYTLFYGGIAIMLWCIGCGIVYVLEGL